MSSYGQCCVHSATLHGVQAVPVDVEVSVGRGLPTFCIVGMPDAAVQEARERVKMAVGASGFSFPGDRIIVNLAPASIKKAGTGFDLPIALGVLAATGQIDGDWLRYRLFVGELALTGGVREIPGLLAFALCAQEQGLDYVAPARQSQLVPIEGLRQLGMDQLIDIREIDQHACRFCKEPARAKELDFADIYGHDFAKRAFQIAAAGAHGLLMMGPPGSGKTMLAARMPSILPPLSDAEIMESAVIHSIAGQSNDGILSGVRPFRAPHHSASIPGLVGGGNPVKPGEVSLAHNGVLFLDELAEFKPSVMQSLRQPLEQGSVTVTRANETLVFPAKFQLIAASNPCPCGHAGDGTQECTCTMGKILAYKSRIGGPILDRIDMRIDVGRLDPLDVLRSGNGMTSASMKDAVLAARAYRDWRLSHQDVSGSGVDLLIRQCAMEQHVHDFYIAYAKKNNMSGRGIVRTLGIARTIADMEESDAVTRGHLNEAIGLRMNGISDE